MKNKLFYLLWVAYAAVIVFILAVNNVFSLNAERTSMEVTNIVINLGFLVLIGILFTIATISFVNLNKVAYSLKKVTKLIQRDDYESYDTNNNAIWATLNTKNDLFGNKVLDRAMTEYREQLKKKGNSFASTKFVPIDDFINDSLLEKEGMKFFNSAMPGTLTGIGILGTFLGLSLGLASFSGNDIYTISDNVGPLLSGMKVAFHTSIYGILFSLIYTFVYRSIMSAAYEQLDRFLTSYKHYTNQAIKESEATAAMLVYQANTASLLKEILANVQGQSQEQIAGMDAIVNQFCQQMTYALGADFRQIGDSLRAASQAQAGSAELFQNLTVTAGQLVESNRQMTAAIEAIMREQKEMEKRILRAERKLDNACDEISARLYSLDIAKDFERYEV